VQLLCHSARASQFFTRLSVSFSRLTPKLRGHESSNPQVAQQWLYPHSRQARLITKHETSCCGLSHRWPTDAPGSVARQHEVVGQHCCNHARSTRCRKSMLVYVPHRGGLTGSYSWLADRERCQWRGASWAGCGVCYALPVIMVELRDPAGVPLLLWALRAASHERPPLMLRLLLQLSVLLRLLQQCLFV
jgi:hypothetical protein